MKITDCSILYKWENLKNRQCIKYLFAPLACIYIYIYKYTDKNDKRNTFVFAPIFHELKSKI